jgi:hypothetical protein
MSDELENSLGRFSLFLFLLILLFFSLYSLRRHGIMPKTDIDMTVFQNVFSHKKTSEIVVNPDTVIASHINVDDDALRHLQ